MKATPCLLILASLLAPVAARADSTQDCTAPAYLLTSESPLPKVAATIKAKQPLNILVVGSGSSGLSGPEGSTASYPARLEAALRERLPGVGVTVTTELLPKKTAAEAAEMFDKLRDQQPADRKPTLIIWQTGTFDAVRSVDPDDFRTALTDGIAAVQRGGSDVLLMNLQYSPRMETMLAVATYNDTMRVVALERNVPLFDRFSIMRDWSDTGSFDLSGPSHGYGLARRVHDCIGRTLATLVIDAAHINPTEIGTGR